ncbi:cytochrome P450 4c3-like [Uloborus diversus]|uniref:cytochrome P450 4c3-like n=1 Tax=Uloborus diversus TaxID=327109 RepID=UPI00240A1D73|nr:cytochrome P450 4c3-like [Uloborus diversus]
MVETSVFSFILPFIISFVFGLTLFIIIRIKWGEKNQKGKIPEFRFFPYIGYVVWAWNLQNSKLVPPLCRGFMLLNAICNLFKKEGIAILWICYRPMVFVYKAEYVKFLINHPDLQGKAKEYDVLKSVFGGNLFTLKGDHWQKERKLLTPSFHMGILKDFVPIFDEQSSLIIDKVKSKLHEPWINIDTYVRECLLLIICRTAMGVNFEEKEAIEKHAEAVDEMLKISVHRLFRPWTHYDFIYQFFPMGRKQKQYTDIAVGITDKVIKKSKDALVTQMRNKTNFKESEYEELNVRERKSFMGLLLDHHMLDPSFTLEDLRSEVLTFIAAGHETGTATVAVTLMMLGLYQDVQETAIQEIDSIFHNDKTRPVALEDIANMKYLECVIKETLRLYPMAPIVAREVKENIDLGDYKLRRGTGVIINFYSLHRDPEFFPEPEKFKPERFYLENNETRHPYAYIPFSAGNRNCIAQRYIMTVMKVFVCYFLRHFRIKALDHRDLLNFTWEITMRNTSPIRLQLSPR